MGWSLKKYHQAKKVKLLAGFVPSSKTYIIWQTFCMLKQTRARQGVNFSNILRTHFWYESALRSFSLVTFWLW